MEMTYDWIMRAWHDDELANQIKSIVSDKENIELTIDEIFRLVFDADNRVVIVRPFSDTSDFHWKIIPKQIKYRAALDLLNKNFDNIQDGDIVEIKE